MAMRHYFQESVALSGLNEDDMAPQQKNKPVSGTGHESEDSPTGVLDCNICLDFVHDPVVTLCGHLYCWPCIYKWIHYQSAPAETADDHLPQCPVCKAEVSQETLVPLYGRGLTTKPSEGKAPHLGMVIPRRPPTPRCESHALVTTPASTSPRLNQQLHYHSYRQQPQQYYSPPRSYGVTPMLSLSGTTATNPMIGMFWEMVYPRIFGNSETTLYTYPNSYHLVGSTNPRWRRHVMQADKSLSRVCFFLFCCVVLCLVLF